MNSAATCHCKNALVRYQAGSGGRSSFPKITAGLKMGRRSEAVKVDITPCGAGHPLSPRFLTERIKVAGQASSFLNLQSP